MIGANHVKFGLKLKNKHAHRYIKFCVGCRHKQWQGCESLRLYIPNWGTADGGTVVKVLCYKLECR
jgi:hypothetical protein